MSQGISSYFIYPVILDCAPDLLSIVSSDSGSCLDLWTVSIHLCGSQPAYSLFQASASVAPASVVLAHGQFAWGAVLSWPVRRAHASSGQRLAPVWLSVQCWMCWAFWVAHHIQGQQFQGEPGHPQYTTCWGCSWSRPSLESPNYPLSSSLSFSFLISWPESGGSVCCPPSWLLLHHGSQSTAGPKANSPLFRVIIC